MMAVLQFTHTHVIFFPFGLLLTSSQRKELKMRLHLLHLSVYPNKLQNCWTNFYEILHMKNLSKFVDVGTVKLLVRKRCTDCEDSRTGIQDHENGTGRPSTYSVNVNAARDEEMILKNRKSLFEARRSPTHTITRKKARLFVCRCDFK